MVFRTEVAEGIGTVYIDGRFTFERHQSFKAATGLLLEEGGIQEVHLDLSAVDFMDSSALGMVLLLRERAEAAGAKVILARPSPSVQAVLQVVQFGKLFRILE